MVALMWTRDHVHLEEAYHHHTCGFDALLINDMGDLACTCWINDHVTDA